MKLATGDDDGAIKLFKFPCLEKDVRIFLLNQFNVFLIEHILKKSPHDTYYGHSSNVTNVKFLSNGSHLISIGGDDFWLIKQILPTN